MDKKIWLALFLVVLLGTALRFWGLDIQSLSNDELGSWAMSRQDSLGKVIRAAQWDVHPPGYHLFVYYLEKLGDSEAILRLPSAIFGILSIVGIFFLGCRLYSWQEGLVASVLMAFLRCPVYYSQEARPYAMVLFFSMLTVYYWIAIVGYLRKENKIPLFVSVAYLITSVINCYLHYYGLYFFVLQALAGALFFCRSRKGLVFLGLLDAAVALAYMPWAVTVWKHLHKKPWIPAPDGMAESFNGYLKFLFNNSQVLVLLAGALYLYWLVRFVDEMRRFQAKRDLLLIG